MNYTLKTKECDLLLVVVPSEAFSIFVHGLFFNYWTSQTDMVRTNLNGNYEIIGEIDHEGKCSFNCEPFVNKSFHAFYENYTTLNAEFYSSESSLVSLCESQSIPLPKIGEKFIVLKPI